MKLSQSPIIAVALVAFFTALFYTESFAVTSDLKPVNLRTEYKLNPVTDVVEPRLSWELTSAVRNQIQTAYQIVVASSPALVASDKADLWNSTKVTGNATNQVEYAGKLNDAQRADDTYPIYAPAPNVHKTDTYSPGLSEAGIICPYTIYKTYGDTRVIREFWPNMVAYLKFLETKSKGEYVYKEASFEDISPKGGYLQWKLGREFISSKLRISVPY